MLPRHHLRKVVAGNVLHNQKLPLALGEVIADSRQRRVMHASEQSCFSLKLLPQAFIGEQRFLQRHSCIEPLVHRFVDGAHATLTEQADDAIAIL